MSSHEKVTASGEMVGRISLILSAFTAQDVSLGVSEIARRSGLPKSSVSRITRELVRIQFLESVQGSLRPGIRLFELGQLAAHPRDLRKLALPSMADVRNATGQTIHLAVLDRTEVVYIEILPGAQGPRLPSRVGGRLPAHATAVGKALLAFADDEQVTHVLDGSELVRVGPNTITSPTLLRTQLRKVRRDGVAFEWQESGPYVACVAAPVLTHDGQPIAALSVSSRLTNWDEERFKSAVSTAAAALSRTIATGLGRLKMPDPRSLRPRR